MIDSYIFLKHLKNKDKKFHKIAQTLNDRVWQIKLPQTDLQKRLLLYKIIVGQQLSTKAALVIWQRLQPLLNEDLFLKKPHKFKQAGLSQMKINYLQGLKNLDLTKLQNFSDEQIIYYLTQYKGIGVWTAEMSLIFIYGRLDIFSWTDLGLKRAAANFYNLHSQNDFQQLKNKIDKLAPYRSLVALILWHWYDQKHKK